MMITTTLSTLQKQSPYLLRISLAIVYIWFGLLKILGASPVVGLITNTYPRLPEPFFLMLLGAWEILIGIALLTKIYPRVTILLLLLQMGGIFLGLLLAPQLYFQHNNIFLLTSSGEFVIKNLVLISAAFLLWPTSKRIK